MGGAEEWFGCVSSAYTPQVVDPSAAPEAAKSDLQQSKMGRPCSLWGCAQQYLNNCCITPKQGTPCVM
eukprot:8347003-Prorocentrum_lima.AAC.1